MRKYLVGWVALALLCAPPSAWALNRFDNIDSQYPFETTAVTANTNSVGNFGPGSVIYGFRLIADDAGDTCGLYDEATLTITLEQGELIDELREDTDNRSRDSDWPRPYVLQTDLSVLTDGTCIIYHNPF